ncbi:MAG: peptidase S9, partial [Cyanobium sp.]
MAAPLPAELVVGRTPGLKETCFADGWLHWLEQRPDEGGRTTLLRRPAGQPEATPSELTPAPWNLRSRVHAYGGGSYSCGG